MYIPALLHEFKSVSPEVKFFIVKVVQKYGLDSKSVEFLVANIGVTDRVIVSAVSYLLECGHLKRLPSLPISRGRPQNRYQLQRSLSFLLGKGSATVLAEQNLPLIDDLFVDVGSDKENRRHKLRVSNRLLLAVLLAHADKFGVVRDLGSADLKRLTGMTAGGLESQLVKLKNAGYIRFCVSGVTAKYLLGMSKSIYYLNLKHPSFLGAARIGLTVLCDTYTLSYEHEQSEAHRIYGVVRKIREDELWKSKQMFSFRQIECYFDTSDELLPACTNYAAILPFFNDSSRSGMENYLQSKLCDYASFLLSSHWRDLTGKRRITASELHQRIEQELLYPVYLDKEEGVSDIPSREAKDLFVDFIYKTSLLLAAKAHFILKNIKGITFANMDFRILPRPKNGWPRREIAFECYNKINTSGASRFLYITDKTNQTNQINELEVFEFAEEDKFPLEGRYASGLLTDPDDKKAIPQKAQLGLNEKSKNLDTPPIS